MKKFPSIRTRMIRSFLVLALVPSLCVSMILFFTISGMEQDQALRKAQEAVNQMADELNLLISKTEITAQTLSADRTIRMAYNDFLLGISLSKEIDYYRQISDVLNWAMFNQDFVRIRVYLPDSNLATREQLSIFGLSMLDNESLPINIRTGVTSNGWVASSNHVSYYQKITLRSSSGGIILALDLVPSSFENILVNKGINGNFKIISPNKELFINYTSLNKNHNDKTFAINAAAGSWTLEASIPEKQFLTAGSGIWWLLTFGSLLIFGLLLPLAVNLNARRLSMEIIQFTKAINVIQDGKYNNIPVNGKTNELRLMQEAYNNMVQRIDALYNDIYVKQIELKEVQLQQLYEQIKPHFLYNILEAGKWLAQLNNDLQTSVFLEKLGQMYRLGLSRGPDIVPLHQELEHTRLYMDLMPYRTLQVIQLQVNIPKDLMATPVIKLLLQPLIENAIEHGIRQRDGDGLITITASKLANTITIQINDNGINLPEENLKKLNNRDKFGYGLDNINKRLRIQYGQAYTFRFENQQSQGVIVTISFPVKKE